LIPENQQPQFEKMINVAIKLVLIQPRVKKCYNRLACCLPCFNKYKK